MPAFSAFQRKSVLRDFDPRDVHARTRGRFDSVDYVDGRPGLVAHPQPTIVPRGATLLVSGWTVDPHSGEAPAEVRVLLDGVKPFRARTGIARGDIMLAEKTSEFVGYQLTMATDPLGTGAHELRTFALGSDGKWYESALAGFRVFEHHATAGAAAPAPSGAAIELAPLRELGTGRTVEAGTAVRADKWVLVGGRTTAATTGFAPETAVVEDARGRRWSGPGNLERPSAGDPRGIDDRTGFEVAVPAAVLGPGRHELTVFTFDAGRKRVSRSSVAALRVIGPERPFPLTARTAGAPAFAARLRVVGDFRDLDDRGPTQLLAALPAGSLHLRPGARIVIEGWALAHDRTPADDVFLELTSGTEVLPPRRHPADCALTAGSFDGLPPAPREDAFFRVTFDMPNRPGDTYALALDVVLPERRAFARAELASIILA